MDYSSDSAHLPDCNSIIKTVESINSQFEAKKIGFNDGKTQSFSSQSENKKSSEVFIVMLEILAIFMGISLRAFARLLKTAEDFIIHGIDHCLTFFFENVKMTNFNLFNIKKIAKELKLRQNFFIAIIPLVLFSTLLAICRLAKLVTKILLFKIPLP